MSNISKDKKNISFIGIFPPRKITLISFKKERVCHSYEYYDDSYYFFTEERYTLFGKKIKDLKFIVRRTEKGRNRDCWNCHEPGKELTSKDWRIINKVDEMYEAQAQERRRIAREKREAEEALKKAELFDEKINVVGFE